MPSRSRLLSAELVKSWLVRRPPNSHKGDFGHVLIIAGSRGMVGAGILSAHGALRSGAGLVTLAVPESQQSAASKNVRPEAMTLGLPENADGGISSKAKNPLLLYIRKRKITSIVIGPGLSRNPETAIFVRDFLLALNDCEPPKAILLDADGFLSCSKGNILSRICIPVVVTPHMGEMSQFLGVSLPRIEQSREDTAVKFAKLFKVVCVLKGQRTVISDGVKMSINPTGNPGMARGGSGDVLSGSISALLLNTKSPDTIFKAACAGVYVHGLAGDLAAKEKTQIGMTAGDIAENLPRAFKKII